MQKFRCGHPMSRSNAYAYVDYRRKVKRYTCKTCRQARSDRRKAHRIEVEGRMVSTWPNCPHGRPVGYTYYFCRCTECTEAWSRYISHYRNGTRAHAVD